MQITENHIQRFFDQQCSAEEARTVVSFLQEHPEIVEQWLGPDWKQAGKEIPVPTSYRQEMLDHVKCHIYFEKPVKKLTGFSIFRKILVDVATTIARTNNMGGTNT